MTTHAIETSPQAYARAGGLLYLYIILAALFAEAYVRGRLIVSTDAAATATNILAHETLFRIGFAGDLLNVTLDVAVAVISYFALLMEFAGLRILGDSGFLKGFDQQQVQALALLLFKPHANGYVICLAFFGFGLIILGYLIFRSGYFPRFLGVLLLIAGSGYLFNSFARFLAPPLADALFPWTLLPGFIAEWALCLWLLFKGVDLAEWQAY